MAADRSDRSRPGARTLGVVVFIAGAAVLATEICASRLLAPYFGSSTVVWANVIGLILIYLSLGYWLGGRLADRRPEAPVLGLILLVAALFIAATPFAAKPVLDQALKGFDAVSVGVVAGSFVAALALFAVPVTLLGMTSPFALRLAIADVEHAGAVAGRLYALSTVGSILGTFFAALIGIEAFGTQRTMVGTAALLALAALPLVGRRGALVPIAVGALLLLSPGTVKASSGLIYEQESRYQYVSIVEADEGERALQLNEGVAYHSLWRADTVLTGGVWDLFLLVPPLLDRPPRSMLVIGNAGGTVARAYAQMYPDVEIDGVEIDPVVSEVGRRYLGLGDNPRLRVHAADGRPFLALSDRRWDVIVVDAYRQPYVPFYLATKEFYALAHERLNPGGVLVLNAARVVHDDRLVRALATTVLSDFPQAWRWRPLRFNELIIAFDRPLRRDELVRRASRAAAGAQPLVPLFTAQVREARAEGRVMTDDRAPVEWLTDRMLLDQIVRGGDVNERSLPTAP